MISSARPFVFFSQRRSPLCGGRVFTGSETQADTNDPGNFEIDAISIPVMIHPQLAQVLAPGVTGAWEWNDVKAGYIEISE